MATTDGDGAGATVELGYVARAHGVLGWLRVHTHDLESELLGELREIALGTPPRWVKLLAAESDATGWRLLVEGVRDKDSADALKGQAVSVRRRDLPPPDDDELYIADLVGCAIVDPAGVVLGEVVRVEPGAQELLVVKLLSGKEALVPFADGICTDVSIESKRITVDAPEGLWELAE